MPRCRRVFNPMLYLTINSELTQNMNFEKNEFLQNLEKVPKWYTFDSF